MGGGGAGRVVVSPNTEVKKWHWVQNAATPHRDDRRTDGDETCGRHMTTVNLLTRRHKALEETHPGCGRGGGTWVKTPKEMGLCCLLVLVDPNADDSGILQWHISM